MPPGSHKYVLKGINVAVWVGLVILLLVVTKFFDAFSTIKRIKSVSAETNPLARRMMARTGTGQAIWLFFFFALIIILLAGGMALTGDRTLQWIFVILGVVLSVIQTAVAHSNWVGHDNVITRQIRHLHAGLNKTLTKM